jgi:hypothetical protein
MHDRIVDDCSYIEMHIDMHIARYIRMEREIKEGDHRESSEKRSTWRKGGKEDRESSEEWREISSRS